MSLHNQPRQQVTTPTACRAGPILKFLPVLRGCNSPTGRATTQHLPGYRTRRTSVEINRTAHVRAHPPRSAGTRQGTLLDPVAGYGHSCVPLVQRQTIMNMQASTADIRAG